jgi:predicted nuclease of predicted toxin-antitoxin system
MNTMRALLDECLPRPLHRYFKNAGMDVLSVHEMGWDGILNGELLNLMIANGFEVLITIDKNLQHQQNLSDAKIALITIKASSNKIKDLKPAMPRVLNALIGIAPGQRIVIEA